MSQSSTLDQDELFGAHGLGLSPRLIEQREAVFRAPPQAQRPSIPAITLAGEQIAAAAAIEAFLASAHPGSFFSLQGLAGTGKTHVLAALARRMGDRALLAAPTGKAATVLARKAKLRTTTLHGLLYSPPDARRHKLVWTPRWEADQLAGSIILVDEASMVDATIAVDLLKTGAIVVSSGDPGQLHPVQGPSFFNNPDFTLTEIRRQAADSPIIRQAHRVRAGELYADDGDAFRIIRERSDDNYGWANVVMCHRNDTRHRINRFLRQRNGIPANAMPRAGEPVICLKNDRWSGLMNGETFTLASNFQEGQPLHLLGHPPIECAWFEPHAGAMQPPGGATGFGLAYAITVHKAQGSEWPRVLIVDEYAGEHRDRWVYTAITRASQAVRIGATS